MNNPHYGFMGYFPCYNREKQKSEKELVKMLKKFCFGGQDEVKGLKW